MWIGAAVKRLIALVVFLQISAGPLAPQSSVSDDQRRFLDVRRRQIELTSARTNLARQEGLFKSGLIPNADLDRARTELEKAQLNYQESVLSLLSLQPRLTIREAVKYQSRDGEKFVRLTVENLTPTFDDSQFKLLSNFEGADPIPESLRTRDVLDIFVSLRAAGESSAGSEAARGTTIAIPYEVHIAELKYGASRTMEFHLLRDVNSVVVASSYKGQNQETVVQLQQAETGHAVAMNSLQASQEADLGTEATFDLKLERSSLDVRRFQLRVLNLPHQISYSFMDPGSQARLSQVNFPAGVTQQNLNLRLFLPERADEQVQVDKQLEFWALAMDDGQAQTFQPERNYSASEVEQSRAGRIRLVILPRGVGRIEVSAASLFSEIRGTVPVETSITVRNTGTRRLDNIKIAAEPPLNWRVQVLPDVVSGLEINREAPVQLSIIPPPDAPVGDYEVRLRTESSAYNRRVPSEDKIYRISIKGQTNIWGVAALIGVLLLTVLGLVIFGVRLTRR